MKPMILGEAPGRPWTDADGRQLNDFPLSGKVSKMLLSCWKPGVTLLPAYPDEPTWHQSYWPLVLYFDLGNVLSTYPGPGRSGASFPLRAAVHALVRREHDGQDRVVVVCGKRIINVMKTAGGLHDKPDFFDWFTWRSWRCVTIPHPSGLNRMYSDEEVRDSVAVAMATALSAARTRETAAGLRSEESTPSAAMFDEFAETARKNKRLHERLHEMVESGTIYHRSERT